VVGKPWPAPAKINWFLQIVGKRADGYHNLQTVFQFLDYGDLMSFELRDDNVVTRNYDYGFEDLRAANLLKAKAPERQLGVSIRLDKKLPIGGGLGGGSSNAATTLIALNHLWEVGLDRTQLAELALTLGADVPIFIFGQSAWAEGVGEQLSAINLAEPWYLVISPKVQVSTKQVFCHKHLTARPEMMKIRALEDGIDTSFGDNQLEPIVRAEYPEVDAVLQWLSEVGKPRMSGSGGSVFMPLENRQQGIELLSHKPTNTTGFVARGINRHPLLEIS